MWFDKYYLWVFLFRLNKPRKMKLVGSLPFPTCGSGQGQSTEQRFRDDHDNDEFAEYFYRTTRESSDATISPSTPPAAAAPGRSMAKEPQKNLSTITFVSAPNLEGINFAI